MIFQYGKSYIHTDGSVLRIVGVADSHVHGKCLIAEDAYGTLTPVGQGEEYSVNYTEFHGLGGPSEFLTKKMNVPIKTYSGRDTYIHDSDIFKIEKIFGFVLYDWQRAYLKGDDSAFPTSGRNNGKTFAYCVRLLLEHRPAFDLEDPETIRNHADEGRESVYNIYCFRNFIKSIDYTLTSAGMITNNRKGPRG